MRGLHEGGPLGQALGEIFSIYLHNQWHKSFPRGGWVERFLLERYYRTLGIDGLDALFTSGRGEQPFIHLEKDSDYCTGEQTSYPSANRRNGWSNPSPHRTSLTPNLSYGRMRIYEVTRWHAIERRSTPMRFNCGLMILRAS